MTLDDDRQVLRQVVEEQQVKACCTLQGFIVAVADIGARVEGYQRSRRDPQCKAISVVENA